MKVPKTQRELFDCISLEQINSDTSVGFQHRKLWAEHWRGCKTPPFPGRTQKKSPRTSWQVQSWKHSRPSFPQMSVSSAVRGKTLTTTTRTCLHKAARQHRAAWKQSLKAKLSSPHCLLVIAAASWSKRTGGLKKKATMCKCRLQKQYQWFSDKESPCPISPQITSSKTTKGEKRRRTVVNSTFQSPDFLIPPLLGFIGVTLTGFSKKTFAISSCDHQLLHRTLRGNRTWGPKLTRILSSFYCKVLAVSCPRTCYITCPTSIS